MYGNMDIDRRHRKCYLMSLSLLGCTGERTVLAEYHFSSVHCDVLARNGTRRELVAHLYHFSTKSQISI